jgi:ketosteroid isomerase-like protein
MKKVLLILFTVAMIITSCQPKTKVIPVDLNASKSAVTELLDKSYSAFNARDVNTYLLFFTDDALLCGTAPGEFWNKTEASKVVTNVLTDTSLNVNLKVNKREVRISKDGNSAVVIDEMFVNFISPKIQIRLDYHLVKNNDIWQIDFCSNNLIPYNEDLPKINKALE